MKLMKEKICMIVPSFSAKGGITSVVSGYKGSQLERDFEVKYIETYCDGGRLSKLAIVLKAYISYIFLLIFWKPSIIHIHSSFGGSFYRKLPFITVGYWFGKPIVNHIHGADFNEFYLRAPESKKIRIRKAYNKCSKIIALSDEWKENLKQIVDENIIVVIENYSILNTGAIEERKIKINTHTALFLGFICKRKGCYDIPIIAERVIRVIPDVKFVLAGSGEIEEIKAITPENVKDNIEYPGWVRGKDKDRLLRNADLFFLPSYNEGMPMSILDAMGYGLPIVSTTVGGITKIVHNGENGYICEPGDIRNLADSIIKLLIDEEKLKSSANESVKIVKNRYSIELHLDKIRGLYLSLI